ncbi:MAG: M48 family metallopeptidase [bacterium]
MSAYSQQSNNVQKTWILIFVFIGLVSGMFYVIGRYQGSWLWPVLGLVISLSQALIAYFAGDKIALAANGAKEVEYNDAPKIFEIVQNLSKIAGIPTPKIYISPDQSANAFACGRDPEHASICLNQGILDLLDKNELEGVIAHELSHIKNRDILVMTVTMVLSSVVSFVADIGFRIMFWGGDRKNKENQNPILLVLYIATIILAPIVSALIQFAISRQREFLADATGVTLTRYPEGLISALEKLYQSPVPSSHYSTATDHFFIAPPKKSFGQKTANLFSTHPSIEDRVQALKNM